VSNSLRTSYWLIFFAKQVPHTVCDNSVDRARPWRPGISRPPVGVAATPAGTSARASAILVSQNTAPVAYGRLLVQNYDISDQSDCNRVYPDSV
jgi:hypothetical protein